MAKKSKKFSDEVTLSNEEYELFKTMTEKLNKTTTVIKVGNDRQTDEEQLERHKESNKDLKRKVAISIQEKAMMQTKIDKLKAVTDKDSSKTLQMMENMERDINKLRKENIGYAAMEDENRILKNKKRSFDTDIGDLQYKLDKEVRERDKQVSDLTANNDDLQKEIDIRIKEDNRFKMLDL